MKYPCNLIRDIMPLYHDEVCSAESAVAVEEHMRECSDCREYYKAIDSTSFMVCKIIQN